MIQQLKKTFIISAVLLLGCIKLNAQDYHFARVALPDLSLPEISILIDNEPDQYFQVSHLIDENEKVKSLMKIVQQMTNEGWEVISAKESDKSISYLMKRRDLVNQKLKKY